VFEDPVEVGSRDRIAKVYIREMAWPGNLKMVLHDYMHGYLTLTHLQTARFHLRKFP